MSSRELVIGRIPLWAGHPNNSVDKEALLRVLETERLIARRVTSEDAEFILRLLNEESFLRYIGDKGVRTTADAVEYIRTGPLASYERFGFGLYLIELKGSGSSIGICGLIKRETLTDIDVGFAFLPEFWSKGYASEAAGAVMAYGRDVLGISRIVAITSQDNWGSIRVLEKLGLRFDRMIRLSDDDAELKLFAPGAMPHSLVRPQAYANRLLTAERKMGTSFVKFNSRGFWSYDGYLEHLLALIAEEVRITADEDWLAGARDHWLRQSSGLFSGWIHPNLDEYLTTTDRRERFLSILSTVCSRPDVTPELDATAELLRMLLEGKLETDESSPLHYMVSGKQPYLWRNTPSQLVLK